MPTEARAINGNNGGNTGGNHADNTTFDKTGKMPNEMPTEMTNETSTDKSHLSRLLAAAFLPGLAVLAAAVAVAAVKAWVLGECDPHFGCSRSITFLTSLGIAAAVMASIGCGAVTAIERGLITGLPLRSFRIALAVVAVALIALFASMPIWPVDGMWLAVGGVVLPAVISRLVYARAARAAA
jgi:hypothetical protein